MRRETINEDGTAVLIETVVYCHFALEIEQHDTIKDAQSYIDTGEDYGWFSSVGVYVDGEPHSAGPFDWGPPEQSGGRRGRDAMREEYAKAKVATAAREERVRLSERRLLSGVTPETELPRT